MIGHLLCLHSWWFLKFNLFCSAKSVFTQFVWMVVLTLYSRPHLVWKYAQMFVWRNYVWRTVFKARSSWKTVSFEEQGKSKDKYQCIFLHQRGAWWGELLVWCYHPLGREGNNTCDNHCLDSEEFSFSCDAIVTWHCSFAAHRSSNWYFYHEPRGNFEVFSKLNLIGTKCCGK